jgi:hypothetical protein
LKKKKIFTIIIKKNAFIGSQKSPINLKETIKKIKHKNKKHGKKNLGLAKESQ